MTTPNRNKNAASVVPNRPDSTSKRRGILHFEARKTANHSPDTPAQLKPIPPTSGTKMAGPAQLQKRHRWIVISLCLYVLFPVAICAWYLWAHAEDRFISNVGFSVQHEQSLSVANPLTDAFSAIGGSTTSRDTDILYEFLKSQHLVQSIDEQFDLRAHFGQFQQTDPVFALSSDATLEEMVDYWPRILRITYDKSTGLMNLQVRAFSPQTAQRIAQAVLSNSQTLINDLNEQSRQDSIRFAQQDLTVAEARLRSARTALINYRTRTQIVDPTTDLAGRLGIVNTLQQQLAEALVEFDLLAQATSTNDPRVVQAQSRIDVIRSRLAEERANVVRGQEDDTGEDYPNLLAEYEDLIVQGEMAEASYRVALGTLEAARADAARQSRYLAAHIAPTLPQSPSEPDRVVLLAIIAAIALLTWTIGVLIYYSLRDSR